MGNGDEIVHNTGNIRALGRQFETTVTPELNKAIAQAGALHLAESAFTAVTYALAIAYTEASAYLIKDMQSKVEKAHVIGENLYKTARIWDDSEQKSTVTEA
ncbi:hypothetical protein [Actinoallomurus sp. NPDC052274]|uniref:hypothetical protein n=1 Tax=Actinoallomurus sp. NPDC052274 TaxID=3155420 RepID=UPI00344884A0